MDARTALEVLSWIDEKYPSESSGAIRPDGIYLKFKWVEGPLLLRPVSEPQYRIDGLFTVPQLQAIAKYVANPDEVCAARSPTKWSERKHRQIPSSPAGQNIYSTIDATDPAEASSRIADKSSDMSFVESLNEYITAAEVSGDERLLSILNYAADCVAFNKGYATKD